MAQPEFEYRSMPLFTTSDLRQEIVVKKLIQEGRTPIIMIHDGEAFLNHAVCFIPKGKNEPEQFMELELFDAQKVGKNVRKFAHQH